MIAKNWFLYKEQIIRASFTKIINNVTKMNPCLFKSFVPLPLTMRMTFFCFITIIVNLKIWKIDKKKITVIFFSPPNSKCLHLFIAICFLFLHSVHSILSTIFLVVLAFFLNIGFDWPPKPFCLRSYLLLPWRNRDSLPFLYWVTLWSVCFLHSLPLQKVRLCFGMFTLRVYLNS